MWIWVLALALASAKPRRPAPAPAPEIVLPSVPAPGADAGFAGVVLPPLAGPTQIPNFQGLSRDTATFTLDLGLMALAGLDAAGIDALFALLAADPGWRVGRDTSGRVAWPTDAGPLGWTLGPEACTSAIVREAPDPRWDTGSSVLTLEAASPVAKLRAFRPAGGLCASFATALRVRGPVEVDLFEAASPDGRSFTLSRLDELKRLATLARSLGSTLVAEGHDPLGEPPGAVEATSLVAAGPGLLEARARLNPGGPAWVWLRLLDAGGAPWAEGTVGAGSVERPGWSRDPAAGFGTRSVVAVPPGATFQGTAEWWAAADDGSVRRLAADPVTIPAR